MSKATRKAGNSTKVVKRKKPEFNLSELIKHTDFAAIRKDKELEEWHNMKPVGREIL